MYHMGMGSLIVVKRCAYLVGTPSLIKIRIPTPMYHMGVGSLIVIREGVPT